MRKTRHLILFILCILSTACANRQSERLARDRRAIEQLRREIEDDRRKLEGQMFGFGRKPDLSGHPGPVSLMGALVNSVKATAPRVQTSFVGGHGEVPTLTKKARPSPDLLESDSTYLNLGCTNLDRPELSGLRPTEAEGEAFTFMSARVVLICGQPPLGIVSTEIFAHRVIMEDVNLLVEGTNWSHLALRATVLELRGANVLRSRAVPAVHGPIVMLSAAELAGEGTLHVISEAYDGPPVTTK